ncbi:hypothetical protein PFY83_003802 [Escherichia coli]|nr:hypothetical protein [Escherichia coli]
MIFIVLSGFATAGLSVYFCDARQGGGAYGKTGLLSFTFACLARALVSLAC